MVKSETLRRLLRTGIIPVVRASSPEEALRAVEAIRAGGIDVIEVTMTVPGAVALIRELVSRFGEELIVGAGTVLNPETAGACIDAGAVFVVSPCLDEPTVSLCRSREVAAIPGALTPTEVVRAWKAGADLVKVFPCSALGGAKYIRSLKAPLPQIELVPTGGVSLETVADYFRAGARAVGAGADLVDLSRIRKGDAAGVTENVRRWTQAIARARTEGT